MDNAFKFKVCETLMNLYCLYRQKWVRMMDPAKTVYPTQTVKERLTDGQIMNHLDGEYAVCVFAGEKATKFITVDVDLGEPEVVRKVINTMVDLGIPKELIYVSSSGRKGYHVDIFVEDFIYNDYAKKFYWALIERSGLDPRKVEFRPTHGQAIKLPLGVHQTTQRRCWFVDRETLEPIEDFEYVFGIERIPQTYIEEIVGGLVNNHMREIYGEIEKAKLRGKTNTDPGDTSLMVTAPGTRHNLQKRVAARARMDGCDYEDIVRIQMEWYAKQNSALIRSSETDVRDDAEMLASWAVRNVEIKPRMDVPKRFDTHFRIHKSGIPYILKAPNKSTRLVLFLLMVFCERYGDAKVSYKTIAEFTGLSVKSVEKAIKWLSDEGYIKKENTRYQRDEFVMLRGVNVYRFPGAKKLRAPNGRDLRCDYVDIHDWLTKENCQDLYIEALSRLCRIEYLSKFLTRPEIAECRKYLERSEADGAEGADPDA